MLTSHVETSSAFVVVVFAALFLLIGLLLVGALCFTVDPFFQGNRDGTAVASKVRLRPAIALTISPGLKCLEQTFVCSVTLKCSPTSLRMAAIHFMNISLSLTWSGNLRVPDCNFRESLAKLEKLKLLIICLKFTFGELSLKILFECSGNF